MAETVAVGTPVVGGPEMTEVHEETAPEAAANPALVGVPLFIVGSVALGLVLIGYVPAAAVGASVPIIATATGIGQIVALIWSIRVGQGAVACVFGVFGGFWISYATLVLGLTHNWFGIPAANVVGTEEIFLIAWLVVIGLLTLGSLRLPSVFTLLFLLVDAALVLVLAGTAQGSANLLKVGGAVVFAFATIGAYLFLDALTVATGGKALPMGRPVLH